MLSAKKIEFYTTKKFHPQQRLANDSNCAKCQEPGSGKNLYSGRTSTLLKIIPVMLSAKSQFSLVVALSTNKREFPLLSIEIFQKRAEDEYSYYEKFVVFDLGIFVFKFREFSNIPFIC